MAYGTESLENIATCHQSLRQVAHVAMGIAESLGMDLTCPEGHRGEEKQEKYFEAKTSQVHFPDSDHNKEPSEAIHIQQYPILWPQKEDSEKQKIKKTGRFYMVAAIMLIAAAQIGVDLGWGGDWDGDGDIMDNDFDDLSHFFLKKKKEV